MRPEPGPDLEHLIQHDLARLSDACRLRARRVVTPVSSTRVRIEGYDGEFVNFASNNYLGLTHHPRVIAGARSAITTYGAGGGAAGLITGHSELHRKAEQAVAAWKGTQDAVLLPSGYQANLAAIGTMGALGRQGGGVRFLVDKLVHASLIDAVRAVGPDAMRVFPHNGVAKLKRLLCDAPAGQLQMVVTESIFSMDGDAADLEGIVALKRARRFVLLVDEAHASGVYGQHGAGYASERGLAEQVDISVVTLSKALGGAGGAVCASGDFCKALINRGRAYMYSTSVPPSVCGGCIASIELLRDEPDRQNRVRALARRVREGVARIGFGIPTGDSPIVPVIFGDESAALAASERLLENGLLVPAVRPPTVARGSSRLRLTLCADHTDGEVERLLGALLAIRDVGR